MPYMGETYISMGIEVGWVMPVFFTLVTLALRAWQSRKAKKLVFSWFDVCLIALSGLALLTMVPFSVFFSASLAFICLGGFSCNQAMTRSGRKGRLVLCSASVVVPALMFLSMHSMFERRVELSANEVSAEEFDLVVTVPRKGLRVHAARSDSWLDNRETWSWTTYSGDELGPSLMGSEVFIGPDGIISGDKLGRRLAEWADTEPEYTVFD